MNGINFLAKFTLVLFLSILGFSTSVEAQWAEKMLNRTLDRTQSAAEKRANRAVNKGIDKSLDKVEDTAEGAVTGKKKKREEELAEGSDDDFLVETAGENLNEPYNSDFIGMFELEFEKYDGSKKEEVNSGKAKYYFNKNQVCVEASGPEKVMLIIDHDTNMMTMANPEKKTAIKMERPANRTEYEVEDYTVVRNGDKKFILGHPCVKYTATSKEHTSILWVDESIRFDYSKAMHSFGGKAKKLGGGGSDVMNQISGFPIEIESTENGKSEKMIIRTTMLEIGSVDQAAFNLSGYEVQDMSAFGN